VGEAPGESEASSGKPFCGSSGQELTRMLEEAGISRDECYLTNVFWTRPPSNKLEAWCGTKKEAGKDYPYPPWVRGKYLLPQHLTDTLPEDLSHLHQTFVGTTVLERLEEEITLVRPNVVVALGNTACWALLQNTGVSKIRGTINLTESEVKVIPTYHPASVLRNWSQRVDVIADLSKAQRESHFPEVHRIERHILIEPTIAELRDWAKDLATASEIAVDIETACGVITMVGFAPSPTVAYVVPFVDTRKLNNTYWDSEKEELQAWELVRSILEFPLTAKTFQNGMYDIQWLATYGIRPRNCKHDTMLAQHSQYPELPKALGWQAAAYTNELAWKQMRTKDSTKREE